MSKGLYRTIDTAFWTDVKVSDELNANEKYLFLYLMTNQNTNLIGCYELGYRKISIDTALSEEDVREAMKKLIEVDIIKYDEKSKEVLVVNWLKHNLTSSEKMKAAVAKQMIEVKSRDFYNILSKKLTELYSLMGDGKQNNKRKPVEVKEIDTISYKNEDRSEIDVLIDTIESMCEGELPKNYRLTFKTKVNEWMKNPKNTKERLLGFCNDTPFDIDSLERWLRLTA